MAKNILQLIREKAEKLRELRDTINGIEERQKEETSALKGERDTVQAELLEMLQVNELASIKVSTGDTYSIGKRKGVRVTNEMVALKWAIENRAVSIDARAVAERLKTEKEMPAGFEPFETEFISVRKAKAKDDNNVSE